MLKKECPECTEKFSRRDVMLRHSRNKHIQKAFKSKSIPPPPQLHINDKHIPEINAISDNKKI